MNYNEIIAQSSSIIEASAGTGKTYAIEQLFLALIKNGEPIQKIVVMTCTEKAMEELQTRFRKILIENQEDNFCYEALANWSKNSISTIHSFCHKILRNFPFEFQISGSISFSEIDYREEVINKIFTINSLQEYREELKILGINSFSKLKTLGKNIFEIIKGCDSEDKFLPCQDKLEVLNSLQKSYIKLQKSFQKFSFYEDDIDKWNGNSANSFRKYIESISDLLKVGFSIENLSKIFCKKNAIKFIKKKLKKNFKINDISSDFINFLVLFEDIYKNFKILKFLSKIVFVKLCLIKINQRKNLTEEFNFDDLIIKVQKKICDEKKNQFLLKILQEKFSYFIIDEFQDTSFREWQILRTICISKKKSSRLIVVGDKKQAIYRFRGANIEAYELAKETILNSGGRKYELKVNWRSLPSVIESCNILFGNSAWFGNEYNKVKAPDKKNKKVKIFLDKTGDASISFFKDSEKFSIEELMAKKVKKIIEENQIFIQDRLENKRFITYNDICFLIPIKSKSIKLQEALNQQKIASFLYKEKGVFQSREGVILSIILRYLAEPNDLNLRKLVLLSDVFAISPTILNDQNFYNNDINILLDTWLSYSREMKWGKLFDSILYESNLYKKMKKNRNFARFYANYQQLVEYILAFACGRNIKQISLFIEESRSEKCKIKDNMFRQDMATSKVTIMTMHSSKGLEFPIVFLLASSDRLSSKIPPYKYSYFNQDGMSYDHNLCAEEIEKEKLQLIAEKKRLFYVAVTRTIFKFYGFIKEDNFYKKSIESLPEVLQVFDKGEIIEKDLNQDEDTVQIKDIKILQYFNRSKSIISFSSLVNNKSKLILTHNGNDQIDNVSRKKFEDLPLGNHMGLAFHTIFENINYHEVAKYAYWQDFYKIEKKTIDKILKNYSILSEKLMNTKQTYGQRVAELVWYTLRNSIKGIDFSLCELVKGNYLNELEFFLDLNYDDKFSSIPDILSRDNYLRGFIDLVFCRGETYYLLDWKSNYLPSYEFDILRESIFSNRYHLQYEIYSIALCRWLKKFNKQNLKFGGTIYAYLRGMDKGQGFYYDAYSGSLDFKKNGYIYLPQFDKEIK